MGRATLTWEGGRDSLILEHSKPWRAWETAKVERRKKLGERNRGIVWKADFRSCTRLDWLLRMSDSYYSAKGKRLTCLRHKSSKAARGRGSEVVKERDTTGARHQVPFQWVDAHGCAWVCVCQRELEQKSNIREWFQCLILTQYEVCFLMKVMLHHSALSFSQCAPVQVNVMWIFFYHINNSVHKQSEEAVVS